MSNINLVTDERSSGSGSFSSPGLIIMVVVLVLVGVLYVGIISYSSITGRNITQIKQEYEIERESLIKGANAAEVLDFSYRLDTVQKLLTEDRNTASDLVEMEKSVIPGVYLENYSYNENAGIIEVTALADNYNTVAKQILSFKQSPYFSGVSAGGTELDNEETKVRFNVSLTINNNSQPAKQ